MERQARFAGWEFHIEQDPSGFRFQIRTNPEHEEAKATLFRQMDELNTAARQAGVSSFELMGHLVKSGLDNFTRRKNR